MYARWHVPSASATPWDGLDERSLPPAQRLVMGWQREQYEWLHRGGGELDREFLDAYERDACPRCGSGRLVRFGHDRNGIRRWRCRACGSTLTPATGTIFEDRKLPAAAWVELLLGLMSYESLAGIARRDRRSPTTPPYQLAKLFLVLDGIQDGVVLEGRVQADEMTCPVPSAEAEMGARGRRPGFSRNQTCVAIACEEREGGSSVFRVLGRGKPSAARAEAAYGPHLSDGLTLVHDKENSHNAVVRRHRLVSEAHDSRVIKALPDGDNPLWKANRLCFLLRLFLDGHTGFDRGNFPGWLDLFSGDDEPAR